MSRLTQANRFHYSLPSTVSSLHPPKAIRNAPTPWYRLQSPIYAFITEQICFSPVFIAHVLLFQICPCNPNCSPFRSPASAIIFLRVPNLICRFAPFPHRSALNQWCCSVHYIDPGFLSFTQTCHFSMLSALGIIYYSVITVVNGAWPCIIQSNFGILPAPYGRSFVGLAQHASPIEIFLVTLCHLLQASYFLPLLSTHWCIWTNMTLRLHLFWSGAGFLDIFELPMVFSQTLAQ